MQARIEYQSREWNICLLRDRWYQAEVKRERKKQRWKTSNLHFPKIYWKTFFIQKSEIRYSSLFTSYLFQWSDEGLLVWWRVHSYIFSFLQSEGYQGYNGSFNKRCSPKKIITLWETLEREQNFVWGIPKILGHKLSEEKI